MNKLVHTVAVVAAMTAAQVAFSTVATPAAGSAEPLACPPGQWWEPVANACRPLPQAMNCPGGWWDPTANVCRPLDQGPQPLNCTNGSWWNPAINQCVPPVLPPSP